MDTPSKSFPLKPLAGVHTDSVFSGCLGGGGSFCAYSVKDLLLNLWGNAWIPAHSSLVTSLYYAVLMTTCPKYGVLASSHLAQIVLGAGWEEKLKVVLAESCLVLLKGGSLTHNKLAKLLNKKNWEIQLQDLGVSL